MTDTEAEQMLADLTRHFRQPVMPVRRYCEALETWRRTIEDLNYRGAGGQGRAYYKHLSHIFTDIRKSALLYRLIYAGEKFRTRQCPGHKGDMDTASWVGLGKPCPHGCDGTGWLPEP